MRILEDKPELWPYIITSIAAHVLLLAILPWAIPSTKFEEKPIEVFTVPDIPSGNQSFRIADIAEPGVQQKPKSAKFLGLYDSTVQDELVGVGRAPGEAGGGAKGGRTRPKSGPKQEKGRAPVSKSGRDKLFAFNKNLFMDKRASALEEGNSDANPGGLDDFYPDFRRGPNTYLNVLRYPGVEYFVRLKRAFKIAFNPEPALRGYFSNNIITRGSIDVVLGVSVNAQGELKELFVFRGSGMVSYDEEALRTVRVSAPFAAPPEKFLADDGLLRMSWTFSVYL